MRYVVPGAALAEAGQQVQRGLGAERLVAVLLGHVDRPGRAVADLGERGRSADRRGRGAAAVMTSVTPANIEANLWIIMGRSCRFRVQRASPARWWGGDSPRRACGRMVDNGDATRSTTISRKPQPEGGQAPVVQRIRIKYAKRGPLRFTSHRDFARAFERALRRARVPIAFSQGFTPHPKISYASAAPTGVASEAEYLEIGLQAPMDPLEVRVTLDAALSPGLDVLDAVVAGPGSLADRIDASHWRIELPGVERDVLRHAIRAFSAAPEVLVERLTKQGRRAFDARGAVHRIEVLEPGGAPSGVAGVPCAILDLVVRQVTPSVRPDDVLSGLRVVADLEPPVPPRATRLAQGTLTAQGEIADPLDADRDGQPSVNASRVPAGDQ